MHPGTSPPTGPPLPLRPVSQSINSLPHPVLFTSDKEANPRGEVLLTSFRRGKTLMEEASEQAWRLQVEISMGRVFVRNLEKKLEHEAADSTKD